MMGPGVEWAERMLNPSAAVTFFPEGYPADGHSNTYRASDDLVDLHGAEEGMGVDIQTLQIDKPPRDEITELSLALATATTEFTTLLRQALESYGSGRSRYQPPHRRSSGLAESRDEG